MRFFIVYMAEEFNDLLNRIITPHVFNTDGPKPIRRTNTSTGKYIVRFQFIVYGELASLIFECNEPRCKRAERIYFNGKGIHKIIKRGIIDVICYTVFGGIQ